MLQRKLLIKPCFVTLKQGFNKLLQGFILLRLYFKKLLFSFQYFILSKALTESRLQRGEVSFRCCETSANKKRVPIVNTLMILDFSFNEGKNPYCLLLMQYFFIIYAITPYFDILINRFMSTISGSCFLITLFYLRV